MVGADANKDNSWWKSNGGKIKNWEVQWKQFLIVENEDKCYFEQKQLLGNN